MDDTTSQEELKCNQMADSNFMTICSQRIFRMNCCTIDLYIPNTLHALTEKC